MITIVTYSSSVDLAWLGVWFCFSVRHDASDLCCVVFLALPLPLPLYLSLSLCAMQNKTLWDQYRGKPLSHHHHLSRKTAAKCNARFLLKFPCLQRLIEVLDRSRASLAASLVSDLMPRKQLRNNVLPIHRILLIFKFTLAASRI